MVWTAIGLVPSARAIGQAAALENIPTRYFPSLVGRRLADRAIHGAIARYPPHWGEGTSLILP